MKENTTNIQDVNIEVPAVTLPDGMLAIITKHDDMYFVTDANGTYGPCKLCGDNAKPGGDTAVVLPKNASNRQWFNRKRTDAAIVENGYCELTYKESKHFGPAGSSLLKNPLIAYMTDEEKAEYTAIVQKAIDAKAADKAIPVTDVDKAKAKMEKAKAEYEKLLAEFQATAPIAD